MTRPRYRSPRSRSVERRPESPQSANLEGRPGTACVLLTSLGPNPAPLVELAWALSVDHGLTAVAAHVVAVERTLHYLEPELLGPGGALDRLRAARGAELLPEDRLTIHEACAADGSLIAGDDSEEHADAFAETIWQAARKAVKEAGERPVIFALAGGRRRTSTALITMAFQLLGRPQDRCVDVRVSNPSAEGGSRFYFPEQPEQALEHPKTGIRFQAREVSISIPDVRLPRLRGLLGEEDYERFADALAASQSRIDEVVPPKLCIDFATLAVSIDGIAFEVTEGGFLFLASLALARTEGEGWLASDDERVRRVWRACAGQWTKLSETGLGADERSVARAWLLGQIDPTAPQQSKGEPLKRLRSGVRNDLKKFCQEQGARWARYLEPERLKSGGKTSQRLPLHPRYIELRNLPAELGR